MVDKFDDATLLAEELGALREQLNESKRKEKELEEEILVERRSTAAARERALVKNSVLLITISLILLGATVAGGYAIANVLTTPQTPDHCVIERVRGCSNDYALTAVVPWHDDRSLGIFSSVESARKAADEMQCPLKR